MISTKQKIFFILVLFFLSPVMANAQTPGAEVVFNIEPSYDYAGRQEVAAFLQQSGSNAYFYVESNYYKNLSSDDKAKFSEAINNLSQEFDNVIYPRLREFYGSEWKPGIDGDNKITVLLFNMKNDAAGYFNAADEYPKIQFPNSNEREMVYLNASQATSSLGKGYLAHEFVHLITFYQKDKINRVTEETWLNEARAEYAPTLLGYNDTYGGSILQKRVSVFLENPADSLTAWQNKKADYGVINLFALYLVDHYGKNILSDSLKSGLVGIPSVNDALKRSGFADDFSVIFTRWTMAVLVNDCSYGDNYCYFNQNLKNFRMAPNINFLPLSGESSLSVNNATYNWAGNWYKIIGGGKGTLTLDFSGDGSVSFKIPYFLCNKAEKCQINSIILDGSQKGKIVLTNFSSEYNSLTFMPSIQSKFSGFDGFEPTYVFSWKISVSENPQEQTDAQVLNLLAQIDVLRKQIADLQAQLASILGDQSQNLTCEKFEKDLYFSMTNSQDVRCLQAFLKSQGAAIYPEGLVTGNFFSLTQAAVIRFQEKYASEILIPLGLQRGTGFMGSATRQKINNLLLK
ncbi:MAG: hypothetical protein ABIG40_01510 [Parcubacteria group bacterium]